MAGFAITFVDIWCLPLSVDVIPAFCIGHLPQFAFAELAVSLCVIGLLELLFAELRALHVDEEQFLILSIYEVLNVKSCSISAAPRTAEAEFGVKRRHSLWNFYLLGAVKAELMLADQLDEGACLFLTI
jgi:hypothetical protein